MQDRPGGSVRIGHFRDIDFFVTDRLDNEPPRAVRERHEVEAGEAE